MDETVSNSTDGEIPILRPAEERHEKSKKTVTFSPGFRLAMISLGSCSGELLDITYNNKLIY